jgi:7-cyano-7-deazaguanine reductase
MNHDIHASSPLGKSTDYIETYSPHFLFPISRMVARDRIGLQSQLPFEYGADLWTGYELSYLNLKGKPQIALAEFSFPHTSLKIVESKSFKLYLNSFIQSSFESLAAVQKVIQKDLSDAVQMPVQVNLFSPEQFKKRSLEEFKGICLDSLDVETNIYQVDSNYLKIESQQTEDETVYTDLFKSNCLATGQPDWGSISIRYSGQKINHESLLKYLISYRSHSGFAEYCVEQIFCDILNRCHVKKLSVYARFTRRGGLDINPFRSNFEHPPVNERHLRQ